MIVSFGDDILPKPKKTFPETKLEEAAGCLNYQGKPKTLAEMEQAIGEEIEKLWNQ